MARARRRGFWQREFVQSSVTAIIGIGRIDRQAERRPQTTEAPFVSEDVPSDQKAHSHRLFTVDAAG